MCVKQYLGTNSIEIDGFPAYGIRIIDTGTFVKKEQEFLEKRAAEHLEKSKTETKKNKKKEPERIKPKFFK